MKYNIIDVRQNKINYIESITKITKQTFKINYMFPTTLVTYN